MVGEGTDCSLTWATVIQTYTSLIYSSTIVLFCMALYVQFRLSTMFHPFFRALFAETLVFYALCDICIVALKIFYMLDFMEHSIAKFFDTMFDYTYAIITPLQSCCLLERLAATICFQTYEKNRKWHLFLLSQPFCVAFVLLTISVKNTFERETVASLYFSYYLLHIVGLLILLYVNRDLTKKYTGYGISLSMRYQLAENIRTIRVFLPMIVFDTLISLTDIVSRYLQLDYVFEPERCAPEPYYLPVYFLSVTISSGLELIEATLILVQYNSWRLFCRRRKVSDHIRVMNVLGSDIMFHPRERNYFDDLGKEWERQRRS